MLDPLALQTIFERIEAGKCLNQWELQILREAAQLQQITIATGERAVAIGGSADGATIVTGDGNNFITITGSNAKAIRELMGKRPPHEELLLEKVKKEVNTRLQKSLFPNCVPIQLGMELQPQEVRNSYDSDIKIGNNFVEPIPKSRNIIEVFFQTEVNGKLLILGNPGGGKTMTMWELANQLCDRAEQLASFPIPVLLNLSMWKDTRNPIQDWLVTELKSRYGLLEMKKDIWTKLVNEAKLLPMLDGLDELPPVHQEPCVRKINEFLQSNCRPQFLVVCSRLEEYKKVIRGLSKQDFHQASEEFLYQDTRLNLNNAILLKDLTYSQIKAYLRDIDQTEELWEMLQAEVELLHLIKTPLFLAMFKFIYLDTKWSLKEWKLQNSTEARHKYIFNAYSETALKRELVDLQKKLKGWRSRTYKKEAPPNTEQTKKWLVYLAKQLERQNQTEFLIERIQPDLLSEGCERRVYALGVGGLFGFILGLIITTINFIIISQNFNVFVGLIVALSLGVFVNIFLGIWAFLTIGQSKNIEPVETLNMSLRSLVKSLIIGYFIGFISWIITLVVFPLFKWQPLDLVFFMVISPILISIWKMSDPQLKITIEPNQGLKNSLYNAICFASLGSVWLGLSAYLLREQILVLIQKC